MSANKRNTRWYRKNEVEVAQMFGMKPTKNSGSGWIEKEDFQNDYILCQLKSTDGQSISIKKKDIDILEYNSEVSHKIPMFMIQFIQSDECFILCRPDDIKLLAEYLETKKIEKKSKILLTDAKDCSKIESTKKIISSSGAKEAFRKESEKRKEENKNGRKSRWRNRSEQKRIEDDNTRKDQVFFS